MTVVLHGATALSTVVIFRRDILEIVRGLLQFAWNEELQFSIKIVLSMLPAAFVGIAFNQQIEQFFDGQLFLVGIMLLVTGLLLFLAGHQSTEKTVTYRDSWVIGSLRRSPSCQVSLAPAPRSPRRFCWGLMAERRVFHF